MRVIESVSITETNNPLSTLTPNDSFNGNMRWQTTGTIVNKKYYDSEQN